MVLILIAFGQNSIHFFKGSFNWLNGFYETNWKTTTSIARKDVASDVRTRQDVMTSWARAYIPISYFGFCLTPIPTHPFAYHSLFNEFWNVFFAVGTYFSKFNVNLLPCRHFTQHQVQEVPAGPTLMQFFLTPLVTSNQPCWLHSYMLCILCYLCLLSSNKPELFQLIFVLCFVEVNIHFKKINFFVVNSPDHLP